MTTQEKIAVMLAFNNGMPIQSRTDVDPMWVRDTNPTWNFDKYEYRIEPKEEKKPETPKTPPSMPDFDELIKSSFEDIRKQTERTEWRKIYLDIVKQFIREDSERADHLDINRMMERANRVVTQMMEFDKQCWV